MSFGALDLISTIRLPTHPPSDAVPESPADDTQPSHATAYCGDYQRDRTTVKVGKGVRHGRRCYNGASNITTIMEGPPAVTRKLPR